MSGYLQDIGHWDCREKLEADIEAVKSGQRMNTDMDKMKKQVMIYSQYQQMKAQAHIQKLLYAGKLWDDDDFKSMKMDEHCKEIEDALEIDKRIRKGKIRVVKTWVEGWENKVLGPSGDEVFEARSAIMVDSSGLIQINVSILQHILIRMHFEKKRGDN